MRAIKVSENKCQKVRLAKYLMEFAGTMLLVFDTLTATVYFVSQSQRHLIVPVLFQAEHSNETLV